MSRSFMDAIRSVGFKSQLSEGAKDKTSDGMTKDAKHFAQDLHKVTDPGMKHLVQKDSETKDYEKMFKGDVDKAPTRPADLEPKQDVDKYVEYNEAKQMAEAKKLKKKEDDRPSDLSDSEDATGPMESKKKCGKGCTCEDCKKSVKEELVSEVITQGALDTAKQRQQQAAAAVKVRTPNDVNKNVSGSQDPKSFATSRSTYSQPSAFQRALGPSIAQSPSRIKPSGMSGSFDSSNQAGMGAAAKAAGSMAVARKPATPATKPKSPGSETAAAASAANNPAQRNLMYTGPKNPPPKPPASEAGATGFATKGSVTNVGRDRMYGGSPAKKPVTSTGNPNMAGDNAKPVTHTGNPNMAGSGAAATKKPAAPVTKKPVAPASGAAQPPARKPGASGSSGVRRPPAGTPRTGGTHSNEPVGPSSRPAGGVTSGKVTGKTITSKPSAPVRAPAGMNPLRQSYEIEWNGKSYIMNESQIQAMEAFIEKYGVIEEGTAGEFIHKEMQHPEKLTAKGKNKKIKQALAIYYSKKRHGENP